MKKWIFALVLFLFVLLFPANARAAGFQFQSAGFAAGGCGFAPVPAFVGGFGFAAAPVGFFGAPAASFQFQQAGRGFRGANNRRGFQFQQGGFGGGNNLQINQQRGFFGRIRSQQIQSSGPGGSFQLSQ